MPEIRPLDFGEVLDGALNLYRRSFGLLVRVAAFTLWLPIGLSIYLQVRVRGLQPDQVAGLMQAHPGAIVAYGVGFAIAYLFGIMLLSASSIKVISASYLGKTTTVGETLSLALSKLFALIGVAFGKFVLIFVAWMAGILAVVAIVGVAAAAGGAALGFLIGFPASIALMWAVVYLMCGYGLTTQIVVLENLDGAFDAFGRSWALTKGARGKVFGMAAVSWVIVNLVPSLALGVASGEVQASAPAFMPVMFVVGALVTLSLTPVIPCVFTLLYYDLRARREGFDLELLGQQLGLT